MLFCLVPRFSRKGKDEDNRTPTARRLAKDEVPAFKIKTSIREIPYSATKLLNRAAGVFSSPVER